MSTVITVENLGKKYFLKHQQGRQPYVALRDVLSDGVKHLFTRFTRAHSSAPACGYEEEFWALKDVSFQVRQGDRIGIIGRNGAGKSTLLKILSRITEPSTGSIRIRGRVASLLEVGTGFHPELTGRENIYLNGAILGMSRTEIRSKFDEIVDFAEVEKFLDTPVKRYSSGMYVRLAFAVAAHLEPDILIVDEVLAVGDAQFQKKCVGKMEDVSIKGGRTVLFVSHNMTTIRGLCGQCIALRDGELVDYGDSGSVIESYIAGSRDEAGGCVDVSTLPRSGGDQVAIIEGWIENEKSEIVTDVQMGTPVRICFRFKCDRTLKNAGFGFGIESVYGQRIETFGNYIISNDPVRDTDGGIAVCHIPELNLMPGNYVVSFGLAEQEHLSVDWVERALPFSVIGSDVFGTGRMYEPSHGVVYTRAEIFLAQ